ncbi:hypothetical protein BH20VER3_BH20VER3_16500 [soil metagenome]
MLVLILGFPIALVLSWAFEITPQGIKLESEVTPSESIRKRTGRKIVGITACLAIARGDREQAQTLFQEITPLPEKGARDHPDDPILPSGAE